MLQLVCAFIEWGLDLLFLLTGKEVGFQLLIVASNSRGHEARDPSLSSLSLNVPGLGLQRRSCPILHPAHSNVPFAMGPPYAPHLLKAELLFEHSISCLRSSSVCGS